MFRYHSYRMSCQITIRYLFRNSWVGRHFNSLLPPPKFLKCIFSATYFAYFCELHLLCNLDQKKRPSIETRFMHSRFRNNMGGGGNWGIFLYYRKSRLKNIFLAFFSKSFLPFLRISRTYTWFSCQGQKKIQEKCA